MIKDAARHQERDDGDRSRHPVDEHAVPETGGLMACCPGAVIAARAVYGPDDQRSDQQHHSGMCEYRNWRIACDGGVLNTEAGFYRRERQTYPHLAQSLVEIGRAHV